MKKCIFTLINILLLISTLFGCGFGGDPVDKAYSKTGLYFDTIISVSIYGMSDAEADRIIDGCFEISTAAEKCYSRTLEGSEIYNINRSNGEAIEVSKKTAELIEKGIEYSRLSDGSFAMSIGALTGIWNFNELQGTPPNEDLIKTAVETIDDEAIIIDYKDNKAYVTLTKPHAAIDLGAIAKGAIADEMKDYLLSEGVESAIINLGGNVMLIGSHPDGTDYKVGIQKPFSANGDALLTVEANDISIVTSGVYQRYFEYDGRLYHHILDPSTGYPADSGLNSVTVIGPSSIDCDALSTTCFLLGEDKARSLLDSLSGYEAIFIDSDNNISCTPGLTLDGNNIRL